jgi:hypothetical protein
MRQAIRSESSQDRILGVRRLRAGIGAATSSGFGLDPLEPLGHRRRAARSRAAREERLGETVLGCPKPLESALLEDLDEASGDELTKRKVCRLLGPLDDVHGDPGG